MSMLLPVVIEQEVEIMTRAKACLLPVNSIETAIRAGFQLQQLKGYQKELNALRKSLTQPLDVEKKAIMDHFRGPEGELLKMEAHLKNELLIWSEQQKKIEAEKQKALEEKAQKQQEQARAMLRATAEACLEEDPFALEEAQRIEMEAQTLCVPTPILPERRALVRGLTERLVYKYEVTDFAALPDDFKTVDAAKLGDYARRLKGEGQVPGVRFFADKIIAAHG